MPAAKNKILDDLALLAGGAASLLSGAGQSLKDEVKTRADEMAQRLDLVPREDFERLEKRVEELEKQLLKTPQAKGKKI